MVIKGNRHNGRSLYMKLDPESPKNGSIAWGAIHYIQATNERMS